jgi:hypothetical protein
MGLARGQTDDEWRGFAAGCGEETNLVSVQIADARDDLKLYRPGEYPVIRGMALQIGERHALLWRSGYVPRLDTYTGPETPNPICVRGPPSAIAWHKQQPLRSGSIELSVLFLWRPS